MKVSMHGGFVSLFVAVLGSYSNDLRFRTQIEITLKEWSNWRQPGGCVEIILDSTSEDVVSLRPVWMYELVWYARDKTNAMLFKLTYADRNPLE